MAFVPPVPLIRRNMILKKLHACGAVSPETARTLAEAGVIRPGLFLSVTDRMVRQGLIHRTADGKYHI